MHVLYLSQDPSCEQTAIWQQLSPYDPTFRSKEHETQLLKYLFSQGASALVALTAHAPLGRMLMFPLNSALSIGSLGLIAFDPKLDSAQRRSVFDSLWAEVSLRAKAAGFKKLLAPMNGLTWFDYRIRTDDHALSFSWEPQPNPLLHAELSRLGFVADTHYRSIASRPLTRLLDETEKDTRSCRSAGYVMREMDESFLRESGQQAIYDITIDAFTHNSYFRPITFDAFYRLYLTGKASVTSYAVAALDSHGKCVGYVYAFLEPSANALVLKTGAVDRAHQGRGISNAMVRFMCLDLIGKHPENFITALVRQGLGSESYARHGETLWEHHYHLLAATLR